MNTRVGGARLHSNAATGVWLLAAFAVLVQFWVHRASLLQAILFGAFIGACCWLSVIDVREHRLPNSIVGTLAVMASVGVGLLGVVDDDLARAFRSVGMGAAALLLLLVVHVVSGGGVGMGDVKFAYPVFTVVGWFGLDSVYVATTGATVAAALALVVMFAGGGVSDRVAFGPYFTIGAAIALALAGS